MLVEIMQVFADDQTSPCCAVLTRPLEDPAAHLFAVHHSGLHQTCQLQHLSFEVSQEHAHSSAQPAAQLATLYLTREASYIGVRSLSERAEGQNISVSFEFDV